MLPHAILGNIFLNSHIFLLCHLPNSLWNRLQNVRNSEIFPKLHFPSCGNYLLVLTNVKKTRFQRKSLNWNLKPKLIKLTIGESQCHGITQMFSCLKQCCTPVVRSYFMKFYFAKWTPSKNITFKKNCT